MYSYIVGLSSCDSWEKPDPHFFDPSPVQPSPAVPYPPGGAEGGTGHTEPDVAASPATPPAELGNPWGQPGNPDHSWTIDETIDEGIEEGRTEIRPGRPGDIPEVKNIVPDAFEPEIGDKPATVYEIVRVNRNGEPVSWERKKRSIYEEISRRRKEQGRPGLNYIPVPVRECPDEYWEEKAREIAEKTGKDSKRYERKRSNSSSSGGKKNL